MEVLKFGRSNEFPLPNLVDLQTKSYEDWLQSDIPFSEREEMGLQAIIAEIFPIESYDGTMSLEFPGTNSARRATPPTSAVGCASPTALPSRSASA